MLAAGHWLLPTLQVEAETTVTGLRWNGSTIAPDPKVDLRRPPALFAGTRIRDATWSTADAVPVGPPVAENGWEVDRWTVEDGLPTDRIRTLHLGGDGYLWIGTSQGLARFDGRRFTTFDHRSTAGLARIGSDIRALSESPDGTLWIATSGGVAIRKAGHWSEPITPAGTSLTRCDAIHASPDGGAWVGTRQGLWRIQGDHAMPVRDIAGLPQGHVAQVLEWNPDSLWVVVFPDLFFVNLRDRTAHHVPHVSGAIQDAALLTMGATRRPILATRQQTSRMSGDLDRWLMLSESGMSEERMLETQPAAVEIAPDDLWLNADPDARLIRWRQGQSEVFGLAQGNPIDGVSSLVPDREGGLWVGTATHGLIRVRRHGIATLSVMQPPGFMPAYAVDQALDGSLWWSSGSGIVHWASNGLELIHARPSAAFAHPEAVFRTPKGKVWVAWPEGGVMQVAQGSAPFTGLGDAGAFVRGERILEPWGVPRVIYGTRDGTFWTGSKHGLIRWWGKSDHFTRQHGLPHDDVRCLHQDREGTLWVGTFGGGISRVQNPNFLTTATNAFQNFGPEHGLSDGRIFCFHEDRTGGLWIGTERGLTRWKNGQLTPLFRRHGLFDETINSILEDDADRLWIGCNRGVFRIDRRTLDAVAEGRASRVESILYGEIDGMLSGETNGERQPAAKRLADGRLCFATVEGIALIDPRDHMDDGRPPTVLIEEVTVDGEPQLGAEYTGPRRQSGTLELPSGRGRLLEIRYTATSLTAPNRVRFEHRLDGVDLEWRSGGPDRTTHYANLRHGTYRFRVRAANHRGVWNPEGASFSLNIAPAFWETRSFYVLCAVGFIGISAAFTGWRLGWQRRLLELRQQHALHHQRERIARDMHDQLGARLSQIALAADDDSPVRAHIRATVRDFREMIWAVDPDQDSFAAFLDFVANDAREFLGTAGLPLDLDLPTPTPELPVPSTTRHALASALRESLHNVVRHAQASNVSIRIQVASGQLEMEVRDNGRGFVVPAHPMEKASSGTTGRGVRNLYARMQELGGSCRIDSSPGQGTSVRLSVPLSQQSR